MHEVTPLAARWLSTAILDGGGDRVHLLSCGTTADCSLIVPCERIASTSGRWLVFAGPARLFARCGRRAFAVTGNPLRPADRATHNGRVFTMTPVVERPVDDCPFWPVEQPGEHYLEVPRSPAPSRVAVLAWALVAHGVRDVDLHADVSDAVGAVDAFLAAEDDDDRHVPGGLRVGSGGVVAEPGCCFGLDEWRTWLAVLDGEAIWLGHSPDTVVEHLGEVVRLWLDEDLANPRFTGPHVDISRDALPGGLREVRRDLVGFLDALGTWAGSVVPARADRFVAAVDRRLGISAPLHL